MCQLARILVTVYFTFCKFTECLNSTDILNPLRLNKEERTKKKKGVCRLGKFNLIQVAFIRYPHLFERFYGEYDFS